MNGDRVCRVVQILVDDLSIRIDRLSKSKGEVLLPQSPQLHVVPLGAVVEMGELESGPALFEETDYQLTIELDGDQTSPTIELHTTDGLFLERLHKISAKHAIWQCPICFRSYVGDFSFQIFINGRLRLSVELEVYPTKLDYREDYRRLLDSVTAYERTLTFRLVAPTTVKHSLSNEPDENRTIPEWLAVLRWKQSELKEVLKKITVSPHRELRREALVRPAALVRRASSRAASWLARHPQSVSKGRPERLLDERRLATVNNRENCYVVGRVRAWRRKLQRLLVKDQGLKQFSILVDELRAFEESPVFSGLVAAPRPKSHILQHRREYRLFAGIDRALLHSVKRAREGLVPLTLKSLHLLYEYWVLLAVHSILTTQLGFQCRSKGPPIKESEVGARLQSKGVVQYDRSDGATAQLVYQGLFNSSEGLEDELDSTAVLDTVGLRSLTANQHPDGILILAVSQVDYPICLVLDAKYRLGGENGGPKISDINTMHRYRDALLLKRPEPSELVYGVTKAWFIYPGDPGDLSTVPQAFPNKKRSSKRRFWEAALSLGVGAIPALPGREHLLAHALVTVAGSAPGSLESDRPRTLHRGHITLVEDESCLRAVVGTEQRLGIHNDLGLYHVPDFRAPEGSDKVKYLFLGIRRKGTEHSTLHFPAYIFQGSFIGSMERTSFPSGYLEALGASILKEKPKKYLLFSLRDRIELPHAPELGIEKSGTLEDYFQIMTVRELLSRL